MVAVRSSGLALDCIVGSVEPGSVIGEEVIHSSVSEAYLETVVGIANARFEQNASRISRFQELLLRHFDTSNNKKGNVSDWEDAEVRRQRKREEGLKKKQELQQIRVDYSPEKID